MIEKLKKISKKHRAISNFKLRRIIFHVCLGFVIMLLARYDLVLTKRLLLAAIIVGIIISMISLRVKIPFIYFMLKKFENSRYLKKFPGKSALFFIAGCLLSLKLFSPLIAMASIAILTFGDPFSYVVSHFSKKRYKKPKNVFKNIYGTLAGTAVSFVVSSFFIYWIYALVASFIAMLVESFIINFGDDALDDNLLVPLVAGTIIYLLIRVNFLERLGSLFY